MHTMKCSILMLCLSTILTIKGEELAEVEEFKKINILFTGNLYKELLKTNTENLVVCPFSIQTVLAMIHAGAGGNTAKELATGSNFPDDSTKVQSFFKVLKLEESQLYILKSVNKLYLANRFKIDDNYRSIVNNVFKADIESINFIESKKAAYTINNWVENQTQNKIKNLIKGDYLGGDTVSVLVNAIYFNADWLDPFHSPLTQRRTFNINRAKQEEVDMMHTVLDAFIHDNEKLNAQFLELPYQSEDVTMTFVLPFEIEGFSHLENNIEEVLKRQPFDDMREVHIVIPKFKMETSISLEPIMQNLGIQEAFTRSANFSGMTVNHPIYLSHVEQKAFIEVTEKGTTAGAATFAISEDRSFGGSRFIANHPFIYLIRHKINGILFVGKFVNPIGTMISM